MNTKFIGITAICLIIVGVLIVLGNSQRHKQSKRSEVQKVNFPTPTPSKDFRYSMNPIKSSSDAQQGTIIISQKDANTEIAVNVSELPVAVDQPAFIKQGTCEKIGPTIFTLKDLDEGSSITTLPVNLSDFMKKRPFVAVVYKSDDALNIITSCGAIK